MKEKQYIKTFFAYLFYHRATFLLLACCACIFALVFSLYTLPLEAILYAAVLCLVLGSLLALLRFPVWYRRHRELRIIQNSILLMTNQLPHPANLIERDYQELVLSLNRLYSKKITAEQMAKTDLMDYYTTWCHQIKTPIAAMSLLLQNEDTPQNRQLKSELFRIEQYVDMVLCYFRLDSPTSDFILKPYDLDDILKQTIRKYAGQFIQKKIQLHYEPVHIQVLTDEKWLSFAIEQILSNAIKYTPSGSVTITVDNLQHLSISDTGIGIAAEDLPRIFEKSFTGYNGRTDKKSTGLGLYLCRNILNKLSHSISVTSKVGKGTTFTIDLSCQPLIPE